MDPALFTASLHRRAHHEFLALSWVLGISPQYKTDGKYALAGSFTV
jgi:hypothetical protein